MLLQQISGAGYSNDKLNTLRQSVAGNYFLVDQVARILPLYVYIDDRLVALQLLAPLIVDRPSGYKLLSQFRDPGDRDRAQKILSGTAPPLPR
jgi:hypothetical protein